MCGIILFIEGQTWAFGIPCAWVKSLVQMFGG